MDFDYKRLVKLEVNVGEKEKKMRLIAGSVLFFISLFTASVILLIVGIILLASGYTKMCPLNSALHRNTCESE
ncbi:MAG: DUF2892 domain-containing protein [Methylococcales symbiont of Iophon sp. n. MRB-2018]|nr:MAG: DUF2892 domain-containing protein [Methylococcales symbiont of Iophon sp. n. MRB-2018]KAF3979761.1 MAG: DUF2892 domain-containing protein [Methylococcales symbiont of Iophon sp. n. MRB-2018]